MTDNIYDTLAQEVDKISEEKNEECKDRTRKNSSQISKEKVCRTNQSDFRDG